MSFRVFWPVLFAQLAGGSADCLLRSDLTGHLWSDATAPLSITLSGSAGSYTFLKTLAGSIGAVLANAPTNGGLDTGCYALSSAGEFVQFVPGSNCNSIFFWQSAANCAGSATYLLQAQPQFPALSAEASESPSPSQEPSDSPGQEPSESPSPRPPSASPNLNNEPSESPSPPPEPSASPNVAGDAVPSFSDAPSPFSDEPSPAAGLVSPNASVPINVTEAPANSPSPLPGCGPVAEVIVPGPLDYISGLPVNGLQTLATTVLNETEGSCPTTTVGTEIVHFVKVTPGLSWIVKLLKGYTLKVTGWGLAAKEMVGFLLDYTTSDDCYKALKVQKPSVPQGHSIVFAINIDRLDATGALLNNYSMDIEVDVDVPIVLVYIFHDNTHGKLLQNEHGHWKHANGKLTLSLAHTSAIVAYTPTAPASSTTQGSSSGSSAGLLGLLGLLAIPAIAACGVAVFLIHRRRMQQVESSQFTYHPYSYNANVVPPPTPVQCTVEPFYMMA